MSCTPGGGGGNSWTRKRVERGVFSRRARIREKGGKIGQKQEKGVFFENFEEKSREKVRFSKSLESNFNLIIFLFEDKYY